MSKSTPISQLPNNIEQNNANDLMLDDDPTVQEVLDQFNQSTNNQNEILSQQPQYLPQQQMMPMAQMPPQNMFAPQAANNLVLPPPNFNTGSLEGKIGGLRFDFDVKHTLFVIAITLAVQMIPFERFVFKYISIEHIPYSAYIVKAIFAGILYFLGKKYI